MQAQESDIPVKGVVAKDFDIERNGEIMVTKDKQKDTYSGLMIAYFASYVNPLFSIGRKQLRWLKAIEREATEDVNPSS